jgi:hypothetical protein
MRKLTVVMLVICLVSGVSGINPAWAAPPPNAPSNLVATEVTATSVSLSWTDNSLDEDGFKVERKTGSGNYSEIVSLAPDTVTYSDSGVIPGTTYHYRVQAFKAGNASYSNEIQVTVPQIPPAAPSGLTATAVPAALRVDLAWTDNSNNEDSFMIERKQLGGGYILLATLGANTSAYSDLSTDLQPNTTYYYRVRAFNSAGYSGYSNEAFAVTSPGGIPAAPTVLAATAASANAINLTWTDNANNETGFKIERRIKNTGSFNQIAIAGANVTSFGDSSGLAAGTTYEYRIRAYNSTGDSAYSNVAEATTLQSLPAKPTNLVVSSVTASSVIIAWTDNATNESGFKIERKTSATAFQEIATVPANTTSFTNTGLSGNTTYIYRVRAWNSAGDSDYSNEVSALTTNIPSAPANLLLSNVTNNSIRLTWQDNSNNETGFRVERSVAGGGFSQVAEVGQNAAAYTDSGLSEGTLYRYRVRAYNSAGNSSYSNTAETTSFLNTPTNLTVTAVTAGSVTLSWTDNSGRESGYRIERRTANAGFTEIATASANTTSFIDTGLNNNTTYYYRVRAFSSTANSAYSGEVTAVTTNIPAAPSSLTVTSVTNNSIRLSWTDNATNESGFKIERRTAGGSWSQIDTVGANSISYNSTGLNNNTTYYYRVRSYNSHGDSVYSNEVGATTGGAPAAPTNLAVSGSTHTSVTLTWTDNAQNEEGFYIERRQTGGTYTQVATVSKNLTTYTDTGLSASTEYQYRIRAFNLTGNSSYSNAVTVTTLAAGVPASPTQLSATALSANSIMLSWKDNANNETGFRIERRLAGGSYSQIAAVGANVTTYTDAGLAANSTYTYRVRAYNSTGNSNYTNEATASTFNTVSVSLTIGRTVYYVNNQQLTMDTSPIIAEKRTLLPIRYVAEAIGAAVQWHAEQQRTTITLGDRVIELWIGRNIATVNGVNKAIDPLNSNVKPMLVPPGRIMLPVRFISENLGCRVDYNSATKEVRITYPAP